MDGARQGTAFPGERFPRVGGILSYFTRHRTAANLLLVLLVAGGLSVLPSMRAQFFPDVVAHEVDVFVTWDGAGADDVDGAIVQLVEPVALSVDGVANVRSTSYEGRAQISIEFEPGWDIARAADEIQLAIDGVSNLPQDAEEPVVRSPDWSDRVTDVVITGPVGADQLALFADEFVFRLFAKGVTRTSIRGRAAPETLVEVPSLSLVRNDVSMSEIANAIGREAEADPAGDVEGANARVRAGVAKIGPDQIAGVVLRTNPDGSKLTVGDVGRVVVGDVDRQRAYFVGEDPAMSVRIDRSDRGDAIGIQRKVEEVVAEMLPTLPDGVRMDLIRTRAEAISGRLELLVDNGLLGLALVVGLLFLFLDTRTAFWVAAGIPVAMIAAIGAMYLMGLTFNMVSLFAMIITLGIVVDDAIVVGEHADARARRGEPPAQAAENAARRMFPPVFSATMTTIIAFFGLTLVGGRFGEFIVDIPLTVIAVLAASLVECFLILPNHMAHSLRHAAREHWYDRPSRLVNRAFAWFRETLFRPFMAFVVRARYAVMAGVILLLVTQLSLFLSGELAWRFFNAPERGSVNGNFAMVPSATREDTIEMMREMQRAAEAVARRYEEEYGANPLTYVIAEVGGNTGRGLSGVSGRDANLLGSIALELIDADLRPYSSFGFVADLQDELRPTPLTEIASFRGGRAGPGGDSLAVRLSGASTEALKSAAETLKGRLSAFPEVSALDDSLAYDKEELVLELTPQGQALGFRIDDLGRALRHRLNGIEAATYPAGPRLGSIRVVLPEGELSADFLYRTRMRTDAGDYVALADLVSVSSRDGFSTVFRENGARVVAVTGDVSEDDPARAAEIMETLETVFLPELTELHGVAYDLGGLSEQSDRFVADARRGFLLSLLGIFLCLAWIFASWTRPLVVMAVMPFGLVGAFYGHVQWSVPLSMFSVVGLIGMTGIIINDSIVLVTTIHRYAKDRALFSAIVDGACDRLRAVVLTTLTTVLGLTPLLYEGSIQAEFLKPTVITLVYGLGFGMVLVLLVVPSLLAMQSDIARQWTAMRRAIRFRRRRARRASAAAAVALSGVAAAFCLTLVPAIAWGTLPFALSGGLDGAEGGGLANLAFVMFLLASACWVFAVYLVGVVAILVGASRRRRAAAAAAAVGA